MFRHNQLVSGARGRPIDFLGDGPDLDAGLVARAARAPDVAVKFVVFDVLDAGRFDVSICYDMWFPETTRTLAAMGAEVILHPTMTDTIDRDVELAIARASAATNQVYFFDINGVGKRGPMKLARS